MTTIISGFMEQSFSRNIANELCKLKKNQFSHLISHQIPNKESYLSNLKLIDATLLYKQNNLHKAFPNIEKNSVSYDFIKKLNECENLFHSSIKRTTPIILSSEKIQNFLLDIVGYFISFFKENKKIDSILFWEVPHMPWDICLFFISKYLGLKVLMTRRTHMDGYLQIIEDFRPDQSNWRFEYKHIYNPLLDMSKKDNFIQDLDSLSLTRDFINASYPKQNINKKNLLRIILDILKQLGLSSTINILKAIIIRTPNNFNCATENSKQLSVLAGNDRLSKWKYIKLVFKYQKLFKLRQTTYTALVEKKINFDIPTIFYALHFEPERTTIPELIKFKNQLSIIKVIAQSLPEGWQLVVKEHPRQNLYDLRDIHFRSPKFYREIKEIKNVILAPIDFNKDSLIEKCKIIATISGSISFEGLIKGKPCIIFGDSWLQQCESVKFISSEQSLKKSILYLQNKKSTDVKKDIVKHIQNIAKYLVYSSHSDKHLKMRKSYFMTSNSTLITNLASAIIQRL